MGSIPLMRRRCGGHSEKKGDGEIPRSDRLHDAGGLNVAVTARK